MMAFISRLGSCTYCIEKAFRVAVACLAIFLAALLVLGGTLLTAALAIVTGGFFLLWGAHLAAVAIRNARFHWRTPVESGVNSERRAVLLNSARAAIGVGMISAAAILPGRARAEGCKEIPCNKACIERGAIYGTCCGGTDRCSCCFEGRNCAAC